MTKQRTEHGIDDIQTTLTRRIIGQVMPLLAGGFLRERRDRPKIRVNRTELESIRNATLRQLYRILFAQFASARGLLDSGNPVFFENTTTSADECVAAVTRLLTQLRGEAAAGGVEFVDYQSLGVRVFGSIHEALIELRLLTAGRGEFYFDNDSSERKATGCYYTPDLLIDYVVAHAVGPVLRHHLDALDPDFRRFSNADQHDLIEKLFDFKVLDPAMGCGHFLVRAADFMAASILDWLSRFDSRTLEQAATVLVNLSGRRVARIDRRRLTDFQLIKRHVLRRCIYGVDLDPLAAELAKASLWLDARAPGETRDFLDQHLRVGDSLAGLPFEDCSAFDCVIGNPPYLGHKGDVDSVTLRRNFRACRDYANPAIAFAELACDHVKPMGAVGLIVPKSIQYVESWAAARTLIAAENRLERLVDVSEAFDDVLLEQSIFISVGEQPAETYMGGKMLGDGTVVAAELPIELLGNLDCLPASLGAHSLRLFAQLSAAGKPLGSFSHTSQALGYQGKLNRDITGVRVPVLRGKQVRPLRLDPPTDWIDESFLRSRSSSGFTEKVSRMRCAKVVSQNIIAHVTKPQPRVWIVSAPDDTGLICLNTVSTTIIFDDRYDHRFVSAVLNSSVASWFYCEFVFCGAVRTMHFDHHYAGKLPIPVPDKRSMRELPKLIREAGQERCRSRRQRLIDDFVFRAYDLSPPDRDYVVHSCFGSAGYAGLDAPRASSGIVSLRQF